MKPSRVLIGISSGIAAVKVPELIPLLQKKGLEVVVMMTEHAAHMVSPTELETISKNPVYTELFPSGFSSSHVLTSRIVDHIQLADSADIVVVIPTTANVLGKLANGIADDFLTTTMLAVTCPVLVFPSMNVHMWENPIVRENIERLRRYGYRVIDPSEGMLACGYEGKGRLPNIEAIAEEILTTLKTKELLKGKRILVTAGGTEEAVDDVRSITNKSSGKMGIAVADVCSQMGAEVILLRAGSAVHPRHKMTEKIFRTSEELSQLLEMHVKKVDIVFHVAAVSDFTVTKTGGKLTSKGRHSLKLIPQEKIVDHIKQWNPNVTLIAFKAEHGLEKRVLVAKARKRLEETGADLIVANDISQTDRGFQSDTNEVILVSKDSEETVLLASKVEIARKIVDYVYAVTRIK